MTVRHEWQTWAIESDSEEYFVMPWGNWAFDGRLGATQKDFLDIFESEVGETEWRDDQTRVVSAGWVGSHLGCDLDEIVPVRLAALGYYYGRTLFARINEQDVHVVDQLRIRSQRSLCWPQDLSLHILFGHSFPSKNVDEPGAVSFGAGEKRKMLLTRRRQSAYCS